MVTRDNLLPSALHGTAWRAAVERRSIEVALVELRTLAHWVQVGYERGLRARRPVHGGPLGNGTD